MSQTLHVVDAFTDKPFTGNSAAICFTEHPFQEELQQLVAREMNLSETSFLHPIPSGYSLRWFTPTTEVELCGHATLASAHVLWETGVLRSEESARFFTQSGWLECRKADGVIEMDFPSKPATEFRAPDGLSEALGVTIEWSGNSGMDYLIEIDSEESLRNLKPNMTALAKFPTRGIIVTCKSSNDRFDFLSRFFAPAAGIDEDPVTGSAHCTLGPYWNKKLGRNLLTGYQASERGGIVGVVVQDDRVLLRGNAVTVSTVEMQHV